MTLSEAIHHCAFEPKFSHAAGKLSRSRFGVLHGEASEAREAARTSRDFASQNVIGLKGNGHGFGRIKNGLQRWRIQSEDGEFDAMCVHIGKPAVTEIGQQTACCIPKCACTDRLPGDVQCLVNRPVLFQRDLPIHIPNPPVVRR
jgi:hypothetical protein